MSGEAPSVANHAQDKESVTWRRNAQFSLRDMDVMSPEWLYMSPVALEFLVARTLRGSAVRASRASHAAEAFDWGITSSCAPIDQ